PTCSGCASPISARSPPPCLPPAASTTWPGPASLPGVNCSARASRPTSRASSAFAASPSAAINRMSPPRCLPAGWPTNYNGARSPAWVPTSSGWPDLKVKRSTCFVPAGAHEALLRRLVVEEEGDSLVVEIEHRGAHVTMNVQRAGKVLAHWAGATASAELLRGETASLCEELTIGCADWVFRRALECGLEMQRCLERGAA